MKRSILITAILCLMVGVTSAEIIQGINIDFVTIGNAGNANDITGYGGVSDVYRISTYEVTAGQYTEFLNAVAATDPYGLYNTKMADISSISFGCNIRRFTISVIGEDEARHSYSVAGEWADRPVNYVSWYDTLRFSNWLHNGQPTGEQNFSTTEDGAYDMSLGSNVVRKAGAQVFLPSEDEWYKAAYHKNDGLTDNYFDYPTSSDSVPSNDLVEPTDPGNNATFDYTIGHPYYRTEVGAHENSDSPYGTFDMGGNVFEWNEALFTDSYSRGVRGGAFSQGGDSFLKSDSWIYPTPDYEDSWIGFRVASVPEPATINIDLDIKPGSCPNPLRVNAKGNGVIPVAILGTEEFDVADIDITTITLEGVAPVRSSFEDVSTPSDGEDCECNSEGADGFLDLTLKFKRKDVLDALGDVNEIEHRTDVPLTLTAMLMDEVELEGSDCITILNRNNMNKPKKK